MCLKIKFLLFLFLVSFYNCTFSIAQDVALVIHGGAGNISKENLPDSLESLYIRKMTETLNSGFEILQNGGSSLDAVKAAINIMEDSPLFNAGKGAVFTDKGRNEIDASIMDGATLSSGAVAGIKHIKIL